MRNAAVATVVALLLAGCSGGGGNVAATEDFSDLGLEATDDTGVIRGVVVDQAIVPIADASIVIKTLEREATSSADGLFGFEDLDPGTYFIDVSRVGYSTVQQSVEVVAGVSDPAIVKVQLIADPSSAPFVEQFTYTGYISCSFKTANFVWDASSCDPSGQAGYADRDDANPFFDASGIPTYFQSEITWQSTQPTGDELVTIQLACEEAGCGETDQDEGDDNRMCNVRGLAPLVCRVNATAGGGGGGVGLDEAMGSNRTGFTIGVYANCDPCAPGTILGFGLVLEQQFDVYAHLFYGYLPPEDWLFTESNTVPSPP